MGFLITIFFVIIAMLLIAFLVKRLVGVIGISCFNCGGKMTPFNALDAQEQKDILEYYTSFEDREPEADAVFVCKHCLRVYDDFNSDRNEINYINRATCKICSRPAVAYMGEYVGSGEIDHFKKKNPDLIQGIECLRCKRKPVTDADCLMCDTPIQVIGCRNCGSLFSWMAVYGSRYKFLVPLTQKNVLKHCRNLLR